MISPVMRLLAVTPSEFPNQVELSFELVHDLTSAEGVRLAQKWPAGKLTLLVTNDSLGWNDLAPGREFYLDLDPVDERSPGSLSQLQARTATDLRSAFQTLEHDAEAMADAKLAAAPIEDDLPADAGALKFNPGLSI